MTAYTNLVGDAAAAKVTPNHVGPQVVRTRINVPELLVTLGIASFASSDTLSFLTVPANCLVHEVLVNVVTAEGATLTIDIGDGSDADGWVDGANINSTGFSRGVKALTEGTPNTITGYSLGKLYTSSDTLDILFNNSSVDTAIFDVFVVLTPLASPALPS